jgi:uncharacterized protein (TIGR03663 family)
MCVPYGFGRGCGQAEHPALALGTGCFYPSLVFLRRVKLPWADLAILVLAAVLRLWALDVKPAHFDEGVNGYFADQMTRTGTYRYDPTNYHGPLHFYGVFVSQTLFGRNLWALRLPAVLASLLAVWAVLRFRVFFGAWAARMAAAAMAVSPAFVYFGRYSIHESALVFFLLVTLLGVLGIWQTGRRRSLWLLAGGLTGMILTKETYAIHVACFALAFPTLLLWQKVSPSKPPLPAAPPRFRGADVALATACGLLVITAFYSGLFLDFSALPGLWTTFATWFETGMQAGGHEKTGHQFGPVNVYWIDLMVRLEWPALAGLAACALTLAPSDARVRYIAICGGGALLAYSIIPYKTPWCVLAIIWPFYLVAACTTRRLPATARIALWSLLLAGSLWSSLHLNFLRYDHDDEPYAYVQTYREIHDATGPILARAAADPRSLHEPAAIILESYYPLPWIFGDFTAIGYHEEDDFPDPLDAAFILTSIEAEPAVKAALRGPYYRREFRLRSGADQCVAFFRHPGFKEIFGSPPDLIGTAPEPPTPDK